MPRKRKLGRAFRRPAQDVSHARMVKAMLADPWRIFDKKLGDHVRTKYGFADATDEEIERADDEARAIEGKERYRQHIEFLKVGMRERPVHMWTGGGISFDQYPELKNFATREQLKELEEILTQRRAAAAERLRLKQDGLAVVLLKVED